MFKCSIGLLLWFRKQPNNCNTDPSSKKLKSFLNSVNMAICPKFLGSLSTNDAEGMSCTQQFSLCSAVGRYENMGGNLEILWIFFGIFWGNFLQFFGNSLSADFLHFKIYLNMEGIDMFVKIFSQWRSKKEGGRILIIRSASASSSHLKAEQLCKNSILDW